MKRAVIFDVDGVLVDSYQAHFESWKRLFSDLGHDYTEDAFRANFGRTSGEILDEWSRRHAVNWDQAMIRALDDRKEALYREVISENFLAIDGAEELIQGLHADGFDLAVGSSGPPENVEVVLKRLAGAEKFSAVVSRTDVARGKPDPEVFLLGAQRLGLPPSACAVIEDAAPGVAAANAAGMASIALVGTTTAEHLAAANLVVDSLRELNPVVIRNLIDSA